MTDPLINHLLADIIVIGETMDAIDNEFYDLRKRFKIRTNSSYVQTGLICLDFITSNFVYMQKFNVLVGPDKKITLKYEKRDSQSIILTLVEIEIGNCSYGLKA